MKKLLAIAIAFTFVFASCGTKKAEPVTEEQNCPTEKKECCKEMTEEQKANCAAWKDWANQTDEKKQELLNKRKECIDKKFAKCEENKEANAEENTEKMEQCAAMKAKFDNWANLTIEEQKSLVDELDAACPKKCEKKEACEKTCDKE